MNLLPMSIIEPKKRTVALYRHGMVFKFDDNPFVKPEIFSDQNIWVFSHHTTTDTHILIHPSIDTNHPPRTLVIPRKELEKHFRLSL